MAAGRRAGLEHPANAHRTAKCVHQMVGSTVPVHLSPEHGRAFFSGLVACGSVWSCPICAAKVQERRREEIAQAIDWAHGEGLQPVMVTLTFPHRAWHSLRQLLDQQADALHRLRAGSPWSRLKQWAGYQGLIRALEVTHGANGWHPHTHELWFVRSTVAAEDLRCRVLARWEAACSAAGLLDLADADQVAAFRRHAVDVRGNCSASDYLAKADSSAHWGADRELAKASSKAGRAAGRHAFGLLDDARQGSARAGRLYLAHALAMRGRRQLFWSAGLKARVGLVDLTDEQLAAEQREEAIELGRIDRPTWHVVRQVEARAAVLDAAEAGGWAAVCTLLSVLKRGYLAPPFSVRDPGRKWGGLQEADAKRQFLEPGGECPQDATGVPQEAGHQ